MKIFCYFFTVFKASKVSFGRNFEKHVKLSELHFECNRVECVGTNMNWKADNLLGNHQNYFLRGPRKLKLKYMNCCEAINKFIYIKKNMWLYEERWFRGSLRDWNSKVRGWNPVKVKRTSNFRYNNLEKVLLSIRMYSSLILINVYLFFCQLAVFIVSRKRYLGSRTNLK